MLILRELFLGPRRFGDLQSALPGIGANLLSKRLRELQDAGILETTGEARSGYRLSEIGESLRPSIRELMAWSIHYFMERPEPSPARDCIYSDDLQPDSVALAIEIFARYRRDPSLSYVARVKIDDQLFTLFYMNEEMIARRGGDSPCAVQISTDVATMMKAFRAELSMTEALGQMTLSGEQKALDHLLSCIVMAPDDFEAERNQQDRPPDNQKEAAALRLGTVR